MCLAAALLLLSAARNPKYHYRGHRIDHLGTECLLNEAGDSGRLLSIMLITPKAVGPEDHLRITFLLQGTGGEQKELQVIDFSGPNVPDKTRKKRWRFDTSYNSDFDIGDRPVLHARLDHDPFPWEDWMENATVRIEQLYFYGRKKRHIAPVTKEFRIIRSLQESVWHDRADGKELLFDN